MKQKKMQLQKEKKSALLGVTTAASVRQRSKASCANLHAELRAGAACLQATGSGYDGPARGGLGAS